MPSLTAGTMVASGIAVILAQMALSVVSVLNGMIQSDLNTSATELTWILDAFLIPVSVLELTFGVLGDIFGRKRLLAGGAALMIVGGLIAFLTPGASSPHALRVTMLIGGQAILGIGAAALLPTSLAMIASGADGPGKRAHAISIWAACVAAGQLISPVGSGLMARIPHSGGPDTSWRWVFLVLAAIAAVSVIATLVLSKDSSAPEGRSLDWSGQVLIVLSLLVILFGVVQGAEDGYGSARIVLSFVIGLILLAVFVAVERRRASPLIDLRLFTSRAFSISAAITVIGMFAYLGTAYVVAVRLAAAQGYSPLKTSLAFIAMNIAGIVLFPVSSKMVQRLSPGGTLAIGMACVTVGDFVLAAIPSTNLSIGILVAPLVVVGIGFKLALTAITVVAMDSVPLEKAGMASAATSMLRDLGLTLGPAIIGSITMSSAASRIASAVSSDPTLQRSLNSFYDLPSNVPPDQQASVAAAVGAVKSGPLGANGVPAAVPSPSGQMTPFNPLKPVAFHALSDAFTVALIVCGIAAAIATMLAVILAMRRRESMPLTLN
ncbi:MFS transporter [Streptomyces malaysiensis]|uniref:MFS transporter n=1 Tax=Streptomyces malaysiensis TaxID=92644 RepID=UPI002B30F640|nr:MFS transporter [Streptomyces malaysiensis]